MRKLLFLTVIAGWFVPRSFAQNLTTVTATNIQKAGVPLASGTLCFTATDANDSPIGFRIGGGGQVVVAPYCAAIVNGGIGAFAVADPANTAPANIHYRIEVFDAYSRVLKYPGVQFSGASFDFDNYVPSSNLPLGSSLNLLSVGTETLTNFFDVQETAAPVNPSNGYERWYADSGTHLLGCHTSSGGNCNPAAGGGSGTVTSVGLSLPGIFNVSGSPVTASGTLSGSFANFGANTFLGNTTGTPAAPVAVAVKTTNLADFNGATPSSSGKIPIWDQPSQTYVPGDPLVQGLVGDGSATAANPVAIGGYDTAGTPALHRAVELNGAPAGTEYGIVTRNIPSGTQTVSVSNTPAVTVSQLPAALDGGGSLKVHEQGTAAVSGTVTANAGTGTFNIQANAAVNVNQVGATAVVANPCQTAVPITVAISQTASTRLIAAASSKKNHICSMILFAGAAEIVSIVEGTGSTCGTSTTAVAGSTTTANGMSLAANGAYAFGNGLGAVIPGIGTNVDTCLFQNGSNRISGMLSYVQQ